MASQDFSKKAEDDVGYHIDLAQSDINSLRESVKKCDIIASAHLFRDIHLHLWGALRDVYKIQAPSREELLKNMQKLEAEATETLVSISASCDVRPKEAFRYIEKLPKE